ncbi:MAG: 50S ribosomal protein L24 [Candidatus Komeilibacteria bacterium RIFCSPLOWO2_02_FULL_48_11]|uniref:Large ribosomal subunit protein uL24 n=1 Tax=Candidatus Komeilibacteria bacterium RIFCSPLOWO2_02_FULL_48_11 TaxID=1798553 RepID=A0A1G2BUV4_9BACT|nr:MAG: 50S ribosomal protein L24 [Candidatus Komeilibacteria bacterium RIFCSPLOWO2_02_FULL_48_11]
MKIKKGDNVKILAGKDKGKSGKVAQVFPKFNRVSVAGINISYKHLRSQRRGQAGQRIEFPSPLALDNVALVCPHCGQATRVAITSESKDSKKTRKCKKCQAAI